MPPAPHALHPLRPTPRHPHRREPRDVRLDMSPDAPWAGHFGTLMPFLRAWERLPRVADPLKEPRKVRPGGQAGGPTL